MHLSFRHQTAGMRGQIGQHRQGPRPQGDHLIIPPQAALRHLQTEGSKSDLVLGFHHTSRRCSLNRIYTLPWRLITQFKRLGHGLKQVASGILLASHGQRAQAPPRRGLAGGRLWPSLNQRS